jgi:hypothetical protein
MWSKYMKIPVKRIVALALVCITLSGCAFITFEDPEEQRRKASEAASEAALQLPDAKAAQIADRVYRQTLLSASGAVLATYEAALPAFSEDGDAATVFERINSHFDAAFENCAADCDGFFASVKDALGEAWQDAAVETPYRAAFTYTLLAPPEKYICVDRLYTYAMPDGAGYQRHYPDVFLAENGWKLSFDSLFGSGGEEAAARVPAAIQAWCAVKNVACERLPDLPVSDFTDYYAMDGNQLLFYTQPFQLSTNDGGAYTIGVPLADFADLFVE